MSLEKKQPEAQNLPLVPPTMPSAPPPPEYNTPRVLHIYRDGITSRHMTVADMDKTRPLYAVHRNTGSIFSSKPHMRITGPVTPQNPNPPMVGTASFHQMSRRVDMEFYGHAVELSPGGIFTRTMSFISPAFGQTLKWSCDGVFGADLILTNGNKEWLAKFDHSVFSITKEGKLHIPGGISGPALDEIVVSGFAMIEHERRRRQSNSAAAGGGGA
ncbi:MAG: hypothetical protein Q9190_003486 [Brigantiaea leucoxantha]